MNTPDTEQTTRVQPDMHEAETMRQPGRPVTFPAAQGLDRPPRVWPLPWWSAISLLALLGSVVALAWAAITLANRPAVLTQVPTPIFLTVTPVAGQSLPVEPEATHTAPEQLEPGDWVQVGGTGGLGVRFRAGPGALYETLKIVPEGTRLELAGEPRQADEHVWWPVHDPSDGVEGWIVSDYLTPVAP